MVADNPTAMQAQENLIVVDVEASVMEGMDSLQQWVLVMGACPPLGMLWPLPMPPPKTSFLFHLVYINEAHNVPTLHMLHMPSASA
jgi:hypothetical protein